MKHHRPCNAEFHHSLDKQRPARERSGHTRTIEMPSRQRRDQICSTEDVDSARANTACDAVQGRENPGDLRLIDGEMGGSGSIQSLCFEDLEGVSRREGTGGGGRRGGCCGSARRLVGKEGRRRYGQTDRDWESAVKVRA